MSCDDIKSPRKVITPKLVFGESITANPAFQVEEVNKEEKEESNQEQKFSRLQHTRVWDMLPLTDKQRDNLIKEFELMKKKAPPLSPITQTADDVSSQTDETECAELDQLAQSLCLDSASDSD